MPIPDSLRAVIGHEHPLDSISQRLRDYTSGLQPNAVGAYQISCSDESERECVESFHQNFVHELLPELKYWSRSSFRTANLGARYESGAVSVADEHFSTPQASEGFKLMMVKLNTHVSVAEGTWHVDARGDQDDVSYVGLADDPRRYVIDHALGKLSVHQ